MTERSSGQGQGGQGGRPGDWGSGGYGGQQYYGAESGDVYRAGAPPTGPYTPGGRPAGGQGQGSAGSYGAPPPPGGYGAGTPAPDPFATKPAYGAPAAGGYGAAMPDPGMARPGTDPASGGVGYHTSDDKGFIASLFDFGFTSFVTPVVIKVLYVLIMIGTILSALAFTLTAFKASAVFGLIVLVIGDPLYIIIVLAFYRIILEFFMNMFRMGQDIKAMRERGGGLG